MTHMHSTPALIDKKGISAAVWYGIKKVLAKIKPIPHLTEIQLDGLLCAPAIFKYQKTIVRGDETECAIALASIVAKVRRARLMCRLATRYPAYGFEQHKGYGTKRHYRAIQKNGLTKAHRCSFLKSLTKYL